MFGHQQMENIHNTLSLIANNKFDRLEALRNANIQKCIQWCQKYGLPYNKPNVSSNIFLDNKN